MSFSYTQHADYADYSDETILRDYAKLRHNYALQARAYASNLIEPVPSYPLQTLNKKTLLTWDEKAEITWDECKRELTVQGVGLFT